MRCHVTSYRAMGPQFLGPSHSSPRHESRFIVVPAPFDATASYGAGARLGPSRIIEASCQLELFDEELLQEPWKAGIFTDMALDMPVIPEKAVEMVHDAVEAVLSSGKVPVLLGGDHSVSIGAIRAVSEHLGPLDILQLDAHTDLRDKYQGSPYSHACVMQRVWDLGNPIQVGIRSLSRREWEFLNSKGKRPVFARDIKEDFPRALERILDALTGRPLYITIDVDCLDPSVMPATGTPEPGGLSWRELTGILKEVIGRSGLAGLDVVELAPVPGLHHCEFTAARLIYRVIGYASCVPGGI